MAARRPSPRPRRRADQLEATRDALLTAGETLVGRHGLDGPSLDAICAAAGFTRGAFYVHFRDRDDFLEALMQRVGARVLDAVLGGGEPLDLAATAQRFLSAVRSGEYPLTPKGGIRPHQLLDACARSPAIRKRYVALVEESIVRVADAIHRGRDGHAVRDDVEPRSLAAVLLAAVIGAQTMIELRVGFDLPHAAATLLALVSRPSQAGAVTVVRRRRR